MQLYVQVRPSIKMKVSLYFIWLLENSGRFSLLRYSAKKIRFPTEKPRMILNFKKKAKQRCTNSPNREKYYSQVNTAGLPYLNKQTYLEKEISANRESVPKKSI